MSTVKKMRSRYYIDSSVQGALLFRAVRYWLLSMATIACLTVLGWLFVWPGIPSVINDWKAMIPMVNTLLVGLVVTLLVLPIVVYDFLKMTNRFAGPVYRLHRSLREMAAGQPVSPVRFRDGDYWQEVADAFNLLIELRESELKELEQLREGSPSEPHDTEKEPALAGR